MDRDAFLAMLEQEGYKKVVTVEREARGRLDGHAHDFEAKALILDGEITIATAEGERTYRPGEVFHLPARHPHTECYGPDGVRYLAGRK